MDLTMFQWFKDWLERRRDAKEAEKRGEVRIAPPGVRGRVYAKKGQEQPVAGGTTLPALAKGEACISAVVIRRDGTRIDLGVISGPDRTIVKPKE